MSCNSNCPTPYMKGEVKVPCGIRNLIKNSAEKCVKQNVSLPKNFCKQERQSRNINIKAFGERGKVNFDVRWHR